MPAPSDLAIATSAVQRLVKEEASYRDELLRQEAHITKLEKDVSEGGPDLDENAEYMLKQEKRAVEETKAVFAPLRQRLVKAVDRLDELVALTDTSGGGEDGPELARGAEALREGRRVLEAKEQ